MASTPSPLVLLTGGTGFLGWYLAQEILRHSDREVAFLVRAPDEVDARRRLERLFAVILGPCAWGRYGSRVRAVRGDVAAADLGLSDRDAAELTERVGFVLHSAGLTDFDKPYEDIHRVNTGGTRHVLAFAERCARRGRLESVAHVSTVGVAGTYRGLFCEDDLHVGQGFNNTYERTKFEAEALCLEYRERAGLNVNIFRPSIIVGDSRTGFAASFKVIYQPIQIFSLGLYASVPADDAALYNIVPVDAAAEAICRICDTAPQNQTFHITHPEPVTGAFVFEQASRFFGYRDPERVPLERFEMSSLRGFRRKLLEPYIPYFNLKGLAYDNRRAMAVLGATDFVWPRITEELLEVVFQFCLDTGFIVRGGGLEDERR